MSQSGSLLPWASAAEEVVRSLQTDPRGGLTGAEAAQRLRTYGPNALPEPEPEPLWKRYWGQLTGDAVVRLLLIGGIASLLLQDYLEGVAIIIMLNIMAGFALWQEGKAEDAARSLRRSDNPLKLVMRDGRRVEVPVEQIVPGDVVYLPTGAIAPADGRVIAAVNAEKDSSKLTGESLPVELRLEPLPAVTVVNEQRNMLHRGDAVTAGNATMVVTATGPHTEIGKIVEELEQRETVRTPLDEQLDNLGDAMARIFMWIAVVVIGVGTVREFYAESRGENTLTVFETFGILKTAFINAVALIIAAIPEGLPAVLTITLAIAMRVMVKRNALVRKPKAVEGGGSMTVLLTDKTGTLTANQMEVSHVFIGGRMLEAKSLDPDVLRDPVTERALRVARLCNNNSDSTEGALLRWVDQAGFASVGDIGREVEHGFDQTLKRMTTVHRRGGDGEYHILTKGAPEQVLQRCRTIQMDGAEVPITEDRREEVRKAIETLAGQGLRVLALADRTAADGHRLSREEAESGLTFVGLLGIMDPPRTDVEPAVRRLAEAGIRTVMVTGDNPLTAYQVARMVGIIAQDMPFDQAVITGDELTEQLPNPGAAFLHRLHTVRVFARVTPQHKAQIVRAMKDQNFIVGMTGDGVNDAIALKDSDVGFGMGNGTDVAREASDVVLTDSRFGTIPNAVEEGRNVLHRIRLYLSYILSGNGCEVGAFVVAYALGIPIPLTALVLLVINFATDSFPALAMAFEPGESDVMRRPPRRRGVPFITRTMWIHIGVQTVVATVVIMAVYYYLLKVAGVGLETARGAAFMTYIAQKLYRAFTARSMTRNIWEIGVFRNPWTLGAVALSLAIALAFVYLPYVNTAVGMAPLGWGTLGIVALAGLLPPIAEEITKLFLKSSTPRPDTHAPTPHRKTAAPEPVGAA